MKTILKASGLIALFACIARADGVQPIVAPTGVLFGANNHTITSSSTAVNVDTTTFRLRARKGLDVSTITFNDGTVMASTSIFTPPPPTWGAIIGTLSNQTDLQTLFNNVGVSTASLQSQISGLGSTYITLSSVSATYLQLSSAAATYFQKTAIIPVANGGTGTSSPALVAGTNISISGSWPNQTINSSGGGGGGSSIYPATATPSFPFGASFTTGTFSGAASFGSADINGNFNVTTGNIVLGDNGSILSVPNFGIGRRFVMVGNGSNSTLFSANPLESDLPATTVFSESTSTLTGFKTFSSPSGIVANFGISAGSITARNLANTIIAADANGLFVSTSVTASLVIPSSAIPFGSATGGMGTDVNQLNWNDTTFTLHAGSMTTSSMTVTGPLAVTGISTLNTGVNIDQSATGAVHSILNFTHQGFPVSTIDQQYFGTFGPPTGSGSLIITRVGGTSLWIDGGPSVGAGPPGSVGVGALQNGTSFYVNGNVVIGRGLSTQASSSARDSGLFVLGGVDVSSNVTITSTGAVPAAYITANGVYGTGNNQGGVVMDFTGGGAATGNGLTLYSNSGTMNQLAGILNINTPNTAFNQPSIYIQNGSALPQSTIRMASGWATLTYEDPTQTNPGAAKFQTSLHNGLFRPVENRLPDNSGFDSVMIVSSYTWNNDVTIGRGYDSQNIIQFKVDSSTNNVYSVAFGTSTTAGVFDFSVSTTGVTFPKILQVKALTHAAITALTPAAVGQIYDCSDCSTVPVCISTGTAAFQWSLITAKTSACQ